MSDTTTSEGSTSLLSMLEKTPVRIRTDVQLAPIFLPSYLRPFLPSLTPSLPSFFSSIPLPLFPRLPSFFDFLPSFLPTYHCFLLAFRPSFFFSKKYMKPQIQFNLAAWKRI